MLNNKFLSIKIDFFIKCPLVDHTISDLYKYNIKVNLQHCLKRSKRRYCVIQHTNDSCISAKNRDGSKERANILLSI